MIEPAVNAIAARSRVPIAAPTASTNRSATAAASSSAVSYAMRAQPSLANAGSCQMCVRTAGREFRSSSPVTAPSASA